MNLIIDYLEDVKKKIIAEANSQGRNKSGKIGDSLEITQNGNNYKLWGFRWIVEAWESGRGPTKNSGDGALRRAIKRWVEGNNIKPKYGKKISQESLITMITNSIHRNGTRLFIRGGHSGVLTNAINEQSLDSLSNKIAINYESEILKIL